MAKPAARPARPTERPAPSWMKPVYRGIGDSTIGRLAPYLLFVSLAVAALRHEKTEEGLWQ